MRYYHDHELAYLRLKSEDKFGWGGVESWDEFLNPPLMAQFMSLKPPLRVLEVGCGTGGLSVSLAMKGFAVCGVDISRTAIEMANSFAQRAQVKVQFIEGDVIQLPASMGQFDLIIDSSCLHCLVFDEERYQALRSWRERLTPHGTLFLHTMIAQSDMVFGERFEYDENGVLWFHSLSTYLQDAVVTKRGFKLPQRRILPLETLKRELASAGLAVTQERLLTRHRKPAQLLAHCQITGL